MLFPSPSVRTEQLPLSIKEFESAALPTPTPSLLHKTFSQLAKASPPCEILRFIPRAAKHACDPPEKPNPLDFSEIQNLTSSQSSTREGTVILLTGNRTFLFFSSHQDLLALRKETLVALCDFIELRLEGTELYAVLSRSNRSPSASPEQEDLMHSIRTFKLLGFDLVAPNSRAWPCQSLDSDEYSCLIYKLD